MGNSTLTPQTKNDGPGITPWAWVIASIVYFVSPIDLVPDIPIIGHIDDVLFGLVSTLNLAQAYLVQSNHMLASIIRLLKIGIIILGSLLVAILALLVLLGIKLFS